MDVSWPEISVQTTIHVNIPHVLRLIDAYRANPILWVPTSPNNKDRNKKCDAWKAIGAELNVDRLEVMKKKTITG